MPIRLEMSAIAGLHRGCCLFTWKRRNLLEHQEAADSGTVEHQGRVSQSACGYMRSHMAQEDT